MGIEDSGTGEVGVVGGGGGGVSEDSGGSETVGED